MSWPLILIVGAVIAAVFLLKRMSFVSTEVARQHLQQGGLVIDVRSAAEFRGDHLPGAINLPLDGLRKSVPARLQDKHQPLLVHCLSGGRSAIATTTTQRPGLCEGV